ncbi:hypothetical protein [Vibrio sp. HN007]|uniref:hypothetical protein n=1 Tax=Vibrio iocasae TaxID=3098914 RepID=UPI0035D3FA5B
MVTSILPALSALRSYTDSFTDSTHRLEGLPVMLSAANMWISVLRCKVNTDLIRLAEESISGKPLRDNNEPNRKLKIAFHMITIT